MTSLTTRVALILLFAAYFMAQFTSGFLSNATNLTIGEAYQLTLGVLLSLVVVLVWRTTRPAIQGPEKTPENISVATAMSLFAFGIVLFFSRFGIEFLVQWPMSLVDPLSVSSVYSLHPVGGLRLSIIEMSIATVVAFSVSSVLVPISEELVFRGVMFPRLAARYGFMRGLVISAVVFGALHYPRVLSAGFHGIIFGLLFVRFRTLAAPIICHITINAFAFFLPAFATFPWEKNQENLSELSNWNLEIVLLATIVLPLVVVAAIWCQQERETRFVEGAAR